VGVVGITITRTSSTIVAVKLQWCREHDDDGHEADVDVTASGAVVMPAIETLCLQALGAVAWYAALVVLTRIGGKRLAGQTTTFDLLILISLGVVLQGVVLQKGAAAAFVFVAVVFTLHRLLAMGSVRWPRLRHLLRGKPRPLIRDGVVDKEALLREDMTIADLKAGLRKAGYDRFDDVETATLEETGQITAACRRAPTPRGSVTE